MIDLTRDDMNRFHYEDWVAHFERNDAERLRVDFSEDTPLNDRERALVFPSIQAFQKGEGSDGRFLMRTVERYVNQGGPSAYRQAMRLFIREENWHSAYLKAYMDHYGIPVAKRSVLDAVFRRLRHLGGLRCEVTVLVTAEMIALTYYDALSACTASKTLKRICRKMLDDELPHIMFQSYTLSRLKPSRVDGLLRYCLMNVTLLFVWGGFHRVYRAGGYSFARFMRENKGYLRQSVHLSRMKGTDSGRRDQYDHNDKEPTAADNNKRV